MLLLVVTTLDSAGLTLTFRQNRIKHSGKILEKAIYYLKCAGHVLYLPVMEPGFGTLHQHMARSLLLISSVNFGFYQHLIEFV